MFTKELLFLVMLFSPFVCTIGHTAQSTSDVPINAELIENARSKVLGEQQDSIKSEEEYVIGHGDILSVQIYGEGDMSAAVPERTIGDEGTDASRDIPSGVPVRVDGRISLKHLGDIEAVGFTLTQLADFLKELYATVYDDPIITAVLVKSNSQRYTIMGKVAQPGVFYLDFPANIVQVIARSGGFTEWAKSEVTLVRKDPKINKDLFRGNKLTFDYDDFLDGKKLERNVLILSGDIIIVH